MKLNVWEDKKAGSLFAPGRLYLLLQRELVHHYKTLITVAAFGFGALLVLNILTGASGSDHNFHLFLYPAVLYWGGLIITSLSFTELHRTPHNYFYLTLPASSKEKYIAKLLLTSLGYILASLVGYFLFSVLATGIKALLYRVNQPIFNPFRPEIGQAILYYLIANSIFLFGALFFKKTHFIKTALALIGFFFALFIATALVIFIVYFDRFQQGIPGDWPGHIRINELFFSRLGQWGNFFLNLLRLVFWFLLPPFFWFLGYLRLKESEARNGV